MTFCKQLHSKYVHKINLTPRDLKAFRAVGWRFQDKHLCDEICLLCVWVYITKKNPISI